MSKNPEKELEEFLDSLTAVRRKEFEQGISSFTQHDLNEHCKFIMETPYTEVLAQDREYRRLVAQIPAKLREYRKRLQKDLDLRPLASTVLPKIREGRPRRDAVVERAEQLKREGCSNAKAAMRLNQEGMGPITSEQLRGLLKYRRRKSRNTSPGPEKT